MKTSYHLSGYRIMWLLIMFDLPVGTKRERDAATRFRKDLLDRGFEMAQYSVYLRYCPSHDAADTHMRVIERLLPPTGKVHMLLFTDKQYANMRTFLGNSADKKKEKPKQYLLF